MMSKARLSIVGFGLACGLTKALALFILGMLCWKYEYAFQLVGVISSVYPGFGPSFVGSLWGALWGLCCGLVFGMIFAIFYNLLLCCCPKSRAECCPTKKEK